MYPDENRSVAPPARKECPEYSRGSSPTFARSKRSAATNVRLDKDLLQSIPAGSPFENTSSGSRNSLGRSGPRPVTRLHLRSSDVALSLEPDSKNSTHGPGPVRPVFVRSSRALNPPRRPSRTMMRLPVSPDVSSPQRSKPSWATARLSRISRSRNVLLLRTDARRRMISVVAGAALLVSLQSSNFKALTILATSSSS
jgi:hypothetical protein